MDNLTFVYHESVFDYHIMFCFRANFDNGFPPQKHKRLQSSPRSRHYSKMLYLDKIVDKFGHQHNDSIIRMKRNLERSKHQ